MKIAGAATAAITLCGLAYLYYRKQKEDETVYYFGYGSNMSSRTLQRRKVTPKNSQAAKLVGYKLAFTLEGATSVEPRFCNIEPDPNKSVHGVLHEITPKQMAQLYREEGDGKAYKKEPVEVITYLRKKVKAYAFILPLDHPNRKEESAPSKRYLGLLIHGAEESGVDVEYLNYLRTIQTAPLPQLDLTEELTTKIKQKSFDIKDIENKQNSFLAVRGIVMDFSGDTTYIANWLGRKDATLQIACFVCDQNCPAPKSYSELTRAQIEYVDAFTASLIEKFPVVGELEFENFQKVVGQTMTMN